MPYRVIVRGADLVERGPLPHLKLTMVPKFCDRGTWVLSMDARSPAVDLIEPGGGIVVYKVGVDAPFMSGPWTASQTSAPSDADTETLTLSGFDDNFWLGTRVVFPNPAQPFTNQTSDATYVATGPLETVSRNLVRLNAASGALSARKVFGLSSGSIPASGVSLGPTTPISSRYDVLLTLLQTMFAGQPYGFRIVQVGATLQFQVYAVVDRSAEVTLSRGRGNLAAYQQFVSAPSANDIAVAGQGVGTARNILEVRDSASIAAWWRSEGFLDRRDTNDNSELLLAGVSALVDGAATSSVSITPIDVDGMEYGVEYGLGDTIGIEINSVSVANVVRQVQITNNGGEVDTVTPLVGSENSTFPWVPPSLTRLRKLATRVGLLEKRL